MFYPSTEIREAIIKAGDKKGVLLIQGTNQRLKPLKSRLELCKNIPPSSNAKKGVAETLDTLPTILQKSKLKAIGGRMNTKADFATESTVQEIVIMPAFDPP